MENTLETQNYTISSCLEYAEAELEKHNGLELNGAISEHVGNAYDQALVVFQNGDANEDEIHHATVILMRASEHFAKGHLKSGEMEFAKQHLYSALSWSDEVLKDSHEEDTAIVLAHRGSILARLGKFIEAKQEFKLAQESVQPEDHDAQLQVQLLETKIYLMKLSPYYNPTQAEILLAQAKKNVEILGDEESGNVFENYADNLLAQGKRIGEIIVDGVQASNKAVNDGVEIVMSAVKIR